MTVVWLITAVILLAILAIIQHFSTRVLKIRTFSDSDIYKFEVQTGRIPEGYFESLEKEEVRISSPFGYKLRGYFLPSHNSDKTVIAAHGVTSSLFGSLKYAELFLKRGYNVLVYDHRRHGKSGGNTTTYGWYEKHDLKACVDWVEARFGTQAEIGIVGESMGAATALQHAAIDQRAAFYVLDCPYSDFPEQLKFRLKEEFHLPAFPLLDFTSFLSWLRSGVLFHKVSPIRDLAKSTAPMLFVHGDCDRYIPKEMTIALFEAKKGLKKLYLAPNADHAESLMKNPEAYDKILGEFLQDQSAAGTLLQENGETDSAVAGKLGTTAH